MHKLTESLAVGAPVGGSGIFEPSVGAAHRVMDKALSSVWPTKGKVFGTCIAAIPIVISNFV